MKSVPVKLAVGLDAGSSRTRCVICALEEQNLRYLGHGMATSSGWVKGRITDQEAAADAIRVAVREAERSAGVSVEALTVGVGGSSIRGAQSRGLYEFGRPREIAQDDMSYVMRMASDVMLERDRRVLHALPQDFTLDGRAGFRKPVNNVCSRLEANAHIITMSQQEHDSVVSAVHLSHLAVEETVFEPMAAAYACVTQEERSRGVAVIDLGMESTGMVVYDGERLVLASNVAMTADHFTRGIAYDFKISYEDAESLKQQYGCAMLGLTSESTLIEIPSAEGRPSREARRSELIEVLHILAEDLFERVRGEIQRAGMDRSLLEGVMLTGAGAELPGMWDMAERKLDCPACHGMAKGIADWPAELNSPAWATAAGLAMYSAKLKFHEPPPPSAGGFLGLLMK
ncbi:MAG: cell division protein FtsA [Acidobacteriota bacterium]